MNCTELNLSGSTVDVTISGLDDGICTLCDEANGLYADVPYKDTPGSCQWIDPASDVDDPGTMPFVSVAVGKCGATGAHAGEYYVAVTVVIESSGGGCTGDHQEILFYKYLGTTKPACLADLNGDVPWKDATNPEGNWGLADYCDSDVGYEDPDAGCTVGSVTCSITFSA